MPLFRHRTALLLLSLLLACPAVLAADSTPRAQVAGVAQAIEDHYFDADRGRDIAQGLRSARSEARRVGTECVRTCRSRWSPLHKQKNNNIHIYVKLCI